MGGIRLMKPMRVIIAGSRTFTDYKLLKKVMDRLTIKYREVTVLSGGAKGADALGEKWAFEWWWTVEQYLPDYKRYGQKAPIMRNQEMVEANATHFVAFWNGKSPGTKDMIWRAKNWNLKSKVILYEE